MSEFQHLSFQAIDKPVSGENLEYMQKQSTRAEVTPWSFTNEYNYSDFRGDALEMMRRGYDLHFHYANFGYRTVYIRLPTGLPDPETAAFYFVEDDFQFIEDKSGDGGTLCIIPCYETDQLDEMWGFDNVMPALQQLRSEILNGDLRPFYLARLAILTDMNHDSEETEGPVPAGLGQLTSAQQAFAEMQGLYPALLDAAAQGAPKLPKQAKAESQYSEWLTQQPEASKNAWLADLLGDAKSSVRQTIMAEYRRTTKAPTWPTVQLNRSLSELYELADAVQTKLDQKAEERATRERQKELAQLQADPDAAIEKTNALVKQRGRDAYSELAQLLARLREALIDSNRTDIPKKHAVKLCRENPTLGLLKSELRKQGFEV